MGNGLSWPPPAPVPAVHPHAYGERGVVAGGFCRARGSSPRIWGTALGYKEAYVYRRFIPTHMGNGPQATGAEIARSVHPHAYGERHFPSPIHCSNVGSSPRIWGTADPRTAECLHKRFIPTHMGNGGLSLFALDSCAVHPHAYGERARLR